MSEEQSESAARTPIRCRILGHKWTLTPPWTGAELRHRPNCGRCGHEPEDIKITGSADEPLDRTTENATNV